MIVYIVVSRWGEYDDKYDKIQGVFDSEEKAQECIRVIENSETPSEEEVKLYNSFSDIIDELEHDLLHIDHVEINSEEWDKELDRKFKIKTGYDMSQYYNLDGRMYSDYRGSSITKMEVQ